MRLQRQRGTLSEFGGSPAGMAAHRHDGVVLEAHTCSLSTWRLNMEDKEIEADLNNLWNPVSKPTIKQMEALHKSFPLILKHTARHTCLPCPTTPTKSIGQHPTLSKLGNVQAHRTILENALAKKHWLLIWGHTRTRVNLRGVTLESKSQTSQDGRPSLTIRTIIHDVRRPSGAESISL